MLLEWTWRVRVYKVCRHLQIAEYQIIIFSERWRAHVNWRTQRLRTEGRTPKRHKPLSYYLRWFASKCRCLEEPLWNAPHVIIGWCRPKKGWSLVLWVASEILTDPQNTEARLKLNWPLYFNYIWMNSHICHWSPSFRVVIDWGWKGIVRQPEPKIKIKTGHWHVPHE